MNKTLNILIAAGGTGGHVFPAQALAETLKKRGHKVYLATDIRGMRFVNNFPATDIKIIDGATVFSKSPILLINAMFKIIKGVFQSLFYIGKNKIDIVVGFGGYPSFAPLLAAKFLMRPCILHEQNAVLGRANRLLARFSKQVALSFKYTKFAQKFAHKTQFIGNPLRAVVRDLPQTDYVVYNHKSPFNLLVFGGSQGAGIFSEVLPQAIGMLPNNLKENISLIQQVQQDDVKRITALYNEMNVSAVVAPFFNDMPKFIAASHLVIGRAGATTVAELCYIGRPSLLVPLPGALDADQAGNAKSIADNSAGWLCEQSKFSAKFLAEQLKNWMNNPSILSDAANNAKNLGQGDAALKLAQMVEKYSR